MKQVIINILGNTNIKRIFMIKKIINSKLKYKEKIKYIYNIIFRYKKYGNKDGIGNQYGKLYSNSRINIDGDNIFIYSIDFYSSIELTSKKSFENLSVDYSYILDKSIKQLKEKYATQKNEYNQQMLNMIYGIENLANNIIQEVSKSDLKNKKEIIECFHGIIDGKISSLYEAMQKLLFYNQILWQSGITLIGLGRIDKYLDKYYDESTIEDEDLENYISFFYQALHKDFYLKSNGTIGDTGQIIVLGGISENGAYFSNKMTYKFISVLEKMHIPDPKLLLRVSSNMPQDLLETAIKCMCSGIGSPLLANDDVIIKKLSQFGYGNDSYNYSVSACWEPFIVGKSVEQNNLMVLNYLEPFNEMLNDNSIKNINNTDDLMELYHTYLNNYLNEFKNRLNNIRFEKNPILSLFVENCFDYSRDVSDGGCKYNNYGVTSVGMSNVVNSIMNIEYYVFDKKKYSIDFLLDCIRNNFNNKEIKRVLKEAPIQKYGSDDKKIMDITNDIMKCTNNSFLTFKNYMGGRLKFGLSSPAYISESKKFPASLDGRGLGEAFGVHISSNNSNYTSLFNFASKIDLYKSGFNGSVIDFIISPSFVKNNFNKFIIFINNSIRNGFFELQMNVVDSKILIAAKNNPDKFPNLIVRVWGFSTYFNELPESYKNVLIERAIANENNDY